MIYNIYALLDENEQVRYVGITKETIEFRRYGHIYDAKMEKPTTHKLCWISSMLKRSLEPSVILLETTNDKNRECFWIQHYLDSGARLTNGTLGGDGVWGYRHTTETKTKLSEMQIGKKPSPELIEKRIAPLRGRKRPPEVGEKISVTRANRTEEQKAETAKKISAAHTGLKYSDEAKNNIRLSKLGKPSPLRGKKRPGLSLKLQGNNLGRKHTEETKRNMSLAKKGKPLSQNHKAGLWPHLYQREDTSPESEAA